MAWLHSCITCTHMPQMHITKTVNKKKEIKTHILLVAISHTSVLCLYWKREDTEDIWGHFMCWFCMFDTGMTALVIHFHGLCQQSWLISFSKTPRALSLIRPFSVGKYHGNHAGKSWPQLSQQTHMHDTQTHTLLLLLKFPTSIGLLACPPWPWGLTSQNCAVIKADTQVELYYQPLDTSGWNSHRSSKIQYTGRSELKNHKDLFEQQIHCGFPWAWRVGLKLFIVDTKKGLIFPLDVKLKYQDFCSAVVESWSWSRDQERGNLSGRMHLVPPPSSFALLSVIESLTK